MVIAIEVDSPNKDAELEVLESEEATKCQKTTLTKFDRVAITKFENGSNEHATTLSYQCSTTHQEMKNLLLYRSLLVKHHKYEFGILERSHHLREVFDLNSTGGKLRFYLSLFLLEYVDAQARPSGKIAMDSVARDDTSSSSSYDNIGPIASRNKEKELVDLDTSHDKGKGPVVG
ncbi:hypothetical protein J1N35_015853 [Gossypium stocksii]|uniref:Uncharacterized protein n=1 Tax=Gossypium stocksii TaxID=47602 RepID=A0A9D4AB80_9ROSI|nr:hypothetical protein J1N35_015853 [Gossypium stocksii]